MNIPSFLVERWIGKYEWTIPYDLAETGVFPLRVEELYAFDPTLPKRIAVCQLDYGVNPGRTELRAAIAEMYPGKSPDDILITHGAIEANWLVMHALVNPGDRVVCTWPVYQQLWQITEYLGAEVHKWDFGRDSDFTEIRKLLEKPTQLLIINSPNNPTGRAFSRDQLQTLVQLGERAGAWIVCDEVYRGIAFDGNEVAPPLTAISQIQGTSTSDIESERTIVTMSLSKVFGLSGLRTGWIVAPPKVRVACLRFRDYVSISPPKISDLLAELAIRHREEVLERNRQLLTRNHRLLMEWATAHHTFIKLEAPQAGTTAFPKYLATVDSETFGRSLAEEYGVLIVPGYCFEIENHFRIGFGCAPEILQTGLEKISAFLKSEL
jgi:aspartate/methionine/tyrosine aminotransferase